MSVIKKTRLNNKGFSHFELGLLIVVIAVIAGVGMFVYNKNNNKSKAGSNDWPILNYQQRVDDYKKLGSSTNGSAPLDAKATKQVVTASSTSTKIVKGKKVVTTVKTVANVPVNNIDFSPTPQAQQSILTSLFIPRAAYNCNVDNGSLKNLQYVYTMKFDNSAPIPNPDINAPGYYVRVDNVPYQGKANASDNLDSTLYKSVNLTLYRVQDGTYVSFPITIDGASLKSTKQLQFTAAKYYNVNFSYARPNNLVLANEYSTFNTWGIQKLDAPVTTSMAAAAQCKTDFDNKKLLNEFYVDPVGFNSNKTQ